MSIITISRGSFSGGQRLAEAVGESLGHKVISREVLVAAAEEFGVSLGKLTEALDQPPSFWSRLTWHRNHLLACLSAALCEQALRGSVVYHGHAGHLLLRGVSHVLRVRLVADEAARVPEAMRARKIDETAAHEYLQKTDAQRVKWTHFLYGVEWTDPTLHDLVLNLHQLSVEDACAIVTLASRLPQFQATPEAKQAIEDALLVARVLVALYADTRTNHADFTVTASAGSVTVGGKSMDPDLQAAAEEVARRVEGVKEVATDLVIKPTIDW